MEQRFLISSRVASALVAACGLFVLLGWILRIPSLITAYGLAPMALSTGIAFLLAGALLGLHALATFRMQLLLFRMLGGVLLTWGVLVFLKNLFVVSFGIDALPVAQRNGIALEGIGPATALTFALLGLALLTFHTRPLAWVGECFATLVGLVGLLIVVGCVYGIPAFYDFGTYMGMTLPIGVNFCLLSLAYLFSRTQVGSMAILTSQAMAGTVARRLLPAAILTPVILGWLHLLAEKYQLFPTDFGTALLILALILFFTAGTVVTVLKLSRLERLSKKAEAEQTLLEALRADVSEVLQHPSEIQELLQKVAQLTVDRLDAAFARVWTIDGSGQILELQASAGLYTHLNGGHSHVPVGQYKIGMIAKERRPLVTNQVLGDLKIHNQEWARREGMVAFAGFPLMREDSLLGVVAIFARHKLSPAEIRVVESISNLLGQALARKRAELEAANLKEQLLRANADLERKVQERTAKLREAMAELEHFSYTITHDMRAPLRAMRGFGQMLLQECADCLDPCRRDFIRRIADSAARMDQLITDALQYSQAVGAQFVLTPVDASALLRGILESYPQLQPPFAEISLEKDLPTVVGNAAGMTQCFSNLLDNAVKFVGPGTVPRVRVRAERRADVARFWFEDNGIGIAPEYHDKIFEMFQRLNECYTGTGIGLALVRKVVQRMGGKVGVESVPGQGSRFWVELKLADQPAVACAA